MSEHHYLGFKSLIGSSIRYIATIQDRWLALLGWSAAALKCQPRDAWIGWSQAMQWQRLPLIVNNVRFLILPDIQIPNLASKILSLNLKRLSQDWEDIYGHPVLIAETFVDTARFTRACYKAANWLYQGQTSGYGKHNSRYVHHGQSKAVFVRPLDRTALIKIRDPHPDPLLIRKEKTMQLSEKQASELIETLRKIPDPRFKKGVRHRNLSIVALSICAVLCGCRGYTAIAQWSKRCSQKMLERLWCRKTGTVYIPPSEPTIRRQLQRIDAEKVDMAISDWVGRLSSGNAIGIDGKTLKGARRQDGSKVHLLSAFIHQQGLTIAQKEVSAKSNEIPSAIPLLESLNLKNKVVTADALHTHKNLARFLVEEKQADYCFTVKDNQPTLKEDIAYLGLKEDFPP
ncbi:Transposase DDE domain-containing protein [Syntrophus gentianae]|uniref:Transposase DDE domain-containing protein n=2 Tax=Syntrophus gentianae TaxID=43775 RepID=A0A1H7Y621_9BACT|nr:Transposase DDE domain-containing protein [Syntrophus gentianae]